MIIPPKKKNASLTSSGRRTERAKNIHKNFKDSQETTYVNAAMYKGNDNMTIAVMDYRGNHQVNGSVRASFPEEAGEAAMPWLPIIIERLADGCEKICTKAHIRNSNKNIP